MCVLAATALAQDAVSESLSAPAIAPAAAPGAAPGGLLPSLVLQPTPVDFAMLGMPQPPRPAPAPELPPEVRALAAQGIQALFNSLAERLGSGGAGRKLKARLPSRSVAVTHRRSQDRSGLPRSQFRARLAVSAGIYRGCAKQVWQRACRLVWRRPRRCWCRAGCPYTTPTP